MIDINYSKCDADYYSPFTPHVAYTSTHTSDNRSPNSIYEFVVDSGATDHMCNARGLFISLDTNDKPTTFARMGDGSITCQIQG